MSLDSTIPDNAQPVVLSESTTEGTFHERMTDRLISILHTSFDAMLGQHDFPSEMYLGYSHFSKALITS
jgi:hypothetical protein